MIFYRILSSPVYPGPFIRYDPAERRYEPHSLFYVVMLKKRSERGAAFERDLLLRAGDLCRDEDRIAEAVGFYAQARDYRHLLSLDFSHLIYEEIGIYRRGSNEPRFPSGNRTFFDIAGSIPQYFRHKLPPAIYIEFTVNVCNMIIDSIRGNKKPLSDFPCAKAFIYQ